MQLYVKLDENNNAIENSIFTLERIAAMNGVFGDNFDPNTYQLPSDFAPVEIEEPIENLTKYQQIFGRPIAKNSSNQWVKGYTIVEVDDETKSRIDGEMSLHGRNYRNTILQNSDWTQLADAPLTAEKKAEWATYRQALRDITSDPGFPVYHKFPNPPL